MRKLGALILLAALTVAVLPAAPALAKEPHRADTDHELVVPPVWDVDGVHLRVWQGTITGDISGCVQWWMDTTTWTSFPVPKNPAKASHYTAKTLVFEDESEGECVGDLILETLERGTTTMANMSWRANGVVVKADPGLFPGWEGRSVHERGTFDMTFDPETGLPNWGKGTSTFRVN